MTFCRKDSVRVLALTSTALTSMMMVVMPGCWSAQAQTVSTTGNGVVTYTSGASTFSAGTPTAGALVIAPTDYPNNSTSKIMAGFASLVAPTTTSTTTNSTILNEYPLTTTNGLNSMSSFTSLYIGSTQSVMTGVKYVPPGQGDNDYSPYYSTYSTAFLKNYEAVDLQVAGIVNNYGLITNAFATSGGAAAGANTASGTGFYVASTPAKVQPPGDPDPSDSLPARTVGVWLNGSGTTLNNHGSITLGVGNLTVPNATLYTVLATDDNDYYTNVKINNYNKIGAYNWATAVTTVAASGSIPATTTKASVQAIEVKENVLNATITNASGGLIEAVANSTASARSGRITTGSSTTDDGGVYTAASYTKAAGGISNVSATAINTDNNTIQLTINNSGVIASALATTSGSLSSNSYVNTGLETYNGFSGTLAVYNGDQYGTAIADSLAQMSIGNTKGASILGDITVGSQSSTITISNAGTITGNIAITPDQGIGKSAVSSTGTATIATSGLDLSATSLYGIYQNGNCVANCSAPGSLYYNSTDQTEYATATTHTNRIVYAPVVNSDGSVGTLSGGIIIQNASGISTANGQSVTYDLTAGGTVTNASAHPFQLVIAPALATGAVLSSSSWTPFTIAGQNISIAAGTYASTTGTVTASALQSTTSGTVTNGSAPNTVTTTCSVANPCQYYNYTVNNVAAITAANIYIQSTPLVKWAFQGQTGANYNPTTVSYVDASGVHQSFLAMNASTATATDVVYGQAISVSQALPGLSQSANSAMSALISSGSAFASTVQQLTSTSTLTKVAEQLGSSTNGSVVQAASGTTTKTLNLIDTHLSGLNLALDDEGQGKAAGNDQQGLGLWAQGFGFVSNQGYRENTDGYSAEAYGYVLGADTRYADNSDTRLGAAISYAKTHIYESGGRQGDVTTLNSYSALLYGTVPLDHWYVNGSLGFGLHHYNDNNIVLGNVVTASHDAYQYTAKTESGYPLKTAFGTYVPVASLTYSLLHQDGYSQAGTAAQMINAANTNSVRTGIGGRAVFSLDDYFDRASLEVHSAWYHELADDTQNITATYVAGGSAFTMAGAQQDRNSLVAGLTIKLTDLDESKLTTLLLSYDAEHKDQFLSHTGSVQVHFDF